MRMEARHTVKLSWIDTLKQQMTGDGHALTVKVGAQEIHWEMTEDSIPDEPFEDYPNLGTAGFNLQRLSEREHPVSDLFECMSPIKIKEGLPVVNAKVRSLKAAGVLPSNFKETSEQEFCVWHAIFFAAHSEGEGGERLWDKDPSCCGIRGPPDFGAKDKHDMKFCRFKQIKSVCPCFFAHPSVTEEDDDWFMISCFIDRFNENRKNIVCSSRDVTGDELMSAFRPRTTKTGEGNERLGMPDVPHVSFILRKPKNLGSEFKVTACAERRVMTFLEIQRGKHGMADAKCAKDLGGQSACAVRMMEAAVGCGRNPEGTKASTKQEMLCGCCDCPLNWSRTHNDSFFCFESLLASALTPTSWA